MENGVMMQYFEWNQPDNGSHWRNLTADVAHLAEIGVTGIWLPPAYKADRTANQGYSTYDLYDFGEFEQKGSVRTKYGIRSEFEAAINALRQHKIAVYLDAVMNHKAGADGTEKFLVREVDPNDRTKAITDVYEIEGWTDFHFPGRKGKYSDFVWHYYHFTGVDHDEKTGKNAIFKIEGNGKSWSENVDSEKGNFDYLMFADLDFEHPDVRAEILRWGCWAADTFNLDGMRLDAVKHIDADFIREFVQTVRKHRNNNFYVVGEYWKDSLADLTSYLEKVDCALNIFDVALHYNFFEAAQKGVDYDLSSLLQNTVVSAYPAQAVTFVDNHDSQRGSALESQIKTWFKPLAYGLILTMKDGYPCVFYGDYYRLGDQESPHRTIIDRCLSARQKYAYGEQTLYFDHANTVGLVRSGDSDHPGSGLAFLMAAGDNGNKVMHVGENRSGQTWHEITGNRQEKIVIGADGNADFPVSGGNIAIWVQEQE